MPQLLLGVSRFPSHSCSECWGRGSSSCFSFNGGKFLLSTKRAVLTQKESAWGCHDAPQGGQGAEPRDPPHGADPVPRAGAFPMQLLGSCAPFSC